jgi:GMP synthase-like glutamine amidotransferase
MKIHCLLHETFEGIASISDWISIHNHSVSYTRIFLNEPFPDTIDFELLIIMGGSASVYEEEKYQWLKEEKQFIKKAISSNCKILGICLGAQLLADVFKSRVYKGPEKEIGWFPVSFNKSELAYLTFLPEQMTVFHWHGDTFDIPKGAIRIGSTEPIQNQGFMIDDHIFAIQFHLEMNENQVQQMLLHGGNDLAQKGNYIQSKNQIISQHEYFKSNNQLMFDLLDFLASK